MSNLRHIVKTQIVKFPEVLALVVTDEAGSLLEVSGDLDGEALGAVHAVSVQALARCGEVLGLGALQRATIASTRGAALIGLYEQQLLGVYLDASSPLDAFEEKLDTALTAMRR